MTHRILEITARADFGGGPEHLFNLLGHLTEAYTIDIACPKQHPYWSRYTEKTNGEILEIPFRKFTISALFKLIRHIKSKRISLIHSHGKGAGVYGRFLSLWTGIEHIHTPHGIHIDNYNKSMRALYLIYERMTKRLVDSVIFVSASEREKAQSLNLWSDIPSHIIPNGVAIIDDSYQRKIRESSRKSLQLLNDELIIVSLSRFDFAKNMQEVALIAEALKKESRIKFILIGDGTDRESIQRWCQEKGLDNIRFIGFVDTPLEYLAAGDIYLSTSRWEGMPLSVLEAMSLGIPVIASAVVGNKDAVDDQKTGLLYELGDIEKASHHIRTLLDDKERREIISQSAKARQVELFSVFSMSKRTSLIYESIRR